jgi:hypothetical protein
MIFLLLTILSFSFISFCLLDGEMLCCGNRIGMAYCVARVRPTMCRRSRASVVLFLLLLSRCFEMDILCLGGVMGFRDVCWLAVSTWSYDSQRCRSRVWAVMAELMRVEWMGGGLLAC